MKALLKVLLAILHVSLLTLAFHIETVRAEPRMWTVDDDAPADFTSIQEAINVASPGDTIYVYNGTYYEHVTLNKPDLTLIGEDRSITVINGSGGDAVSIQADNAKIRSFTIQNGYSGIQMFPWTSGHEISNNIITNNDFGIRGHFDVHRISISENIITSNNFLGIEMAFYYSILRGNVISNNGKGEFLQLSAGIQIVESVYNITISSNNNTIVENIIENNFNGIFSVRHSEDNLFSHNTFDNNTLHILISNPSHMSNNILEENYWSDYTGEDNDGDGLGDTPYVIDAQNKDIRPLMSPFSYWSNPINGDVNKNMKVDMEDIAIVAKAFGSYPGHPRWNPNADITGLTAKVPDSKVDIRDISVIAKNFGKYS